jgi:hypothetical protein
MAFKTFHAIVRRQRPITTATSKLLRHGWQQWLAQKSHAMPGWY